MGLVARAVESAGVATVALSSAIDITAQAPPPRALYVRFPFGRPLGEAGNKNQQSAVLRQAFRLLFEAEEPGTITESGLKWKGERYLAPDWDELKGLGPKD